MYNLGLWRSAKITTVTEIPNRSFIDTLAQLGCNLYELPFNQISLFTFKTSQNFNFSAWLRLNLNTKIGLHTHHHPPPPHNFFLTLNFSQTQNFFLTKFFFQSKDFFGQRLVLTTVLSVVFSHLSIIFIQLTINPVLCCSYDLINQNTATVGTQPHNFLIHTPRLANFIIGLLRFCFQTASSSSQSCISRYSWQIVG